MDLGSPLSICDGCRSDLHASESWTRILGNVPVQIVLHHDYLLTAVGIGLQYSLDCGVRSLT